MSEIKLDPFCAIWTKCICCGAKSRCEETEEKVAKVWNRRADNEID